MVLSLAPFLKEQEIQIRIFFLIVRTIRYSIKIILDIYVGVTIGGSTLKVDVIVQFNGKKNLLSDSIWKLQFIKSIHNHTYYQ